MTVTRQSLRFKCSVKDCPWRDDEEIHVPWCLGIPDVPHSPEKGHQHHPKKGMGGKNPESKIVAILCNYCHGRIDNGTDWGNAVVPKEDGTLAYWAFDLHGKTLIERALPRSLSDGAEARAVTPEVSATSAPSLKEESEPVLSAAAEAATSGSTSSTVEGVKVIADPTPPRGSEGTVKPESVATHTSAAAPSASLTHEQRVAIAQEIRDSEWNRQWIAGDTANAWRAELGEEAEQYICDFGYVQESMANIMYTCESIPKNMRRTGLRFSHHVVMLGLNREDMEMWLDKCEEEQWGVAEFRRQVKGTKPKVRRWSLEELRQGLASFEKEPPQSDEAAMVSAESVVFFLDWLGGQT